jgi:hypothetical protein
MGPKESGQRDGLPGPKFYRKITNGTKEGFVFFELGSGLVEAFCDVPAHFLE